MYDRYSDMSKFITDIEELQVDEESCVCISKWHDITISLEDSSASFAEQELLIVCLIKYICLLDNMVQRFYHHKRQKETLAERPAPLGILRYDYGRSLEEAPEKMTEDFPFELAVIYLLEGNRAVFDYWHIQVNSQLEVELEYKDNKFYLRRFGRFDGITDAWVEAKC